MAVEAIADDEVPGAPLSARAVLLSLLTAAAIGFLFPWANLVLRGSRPANTSLPFGVIAIFFVLVALVNPALKLISRRVALTRGELLVIFVAALLASSVVTWGLVGQLLPIMTGVSYYATAENHWEELFAKHGAVAGGDRRGGGARVPSRPARAYRGGRGVRWGPGRCLRRHWRRPASV